MIISSKELARIKRLDLPSLMLDHGLKLASQANGTYTFYCPFHPDQNPSLKVNRKPNGIWLWHCFGCNAGGDVLKFMIKKENLPFTRAYEKLSKLDGRYSVDEKVAPEPETEPSSPEINPQELLNQVAQLYHNNFKQSKEAQDYIATRGIASKELIDHFRVGFANGLVKQLLPKDGQLIDQLKRTGILNDKGNEFFWHCITFPITDENDQVVGMYGRSIDRSQHLYLPGPHRGVFNWRSIKANERVILTESILDCLSIYQAGLPWAIPCYGTNGFTSQHLDLLKRYQVKDILIGFDNDSTGDEAAIKLANQLTQEGFKVRRIHFPEGIKDANQYFSYTRELDFIGTKATFERLLAHAPRIGYSIKVKPTTEGLLFSDDNQALFQFGELEYKLMGLNLDDISHLRLIITCQKDTRRHTDRFDLYTAKSRKVFSNRCAHRLICQSAKVEDDLLEVISSIEDLKAEHLKQRQQEQRKDEIILSEEEEREALDLLKDPHLMDRIARDLEMVGYVGEPQNKKLAYLVATSRKLSKPLSCILISQSAAGKSYLMELVASLMPAEEVEFYSRLTTQSLYYVGKDQLKNKLLLVDERSGSEEADYPIRNLQTRNKLTLAYPLKDPISGKTRTVVLEIQGPISYMESSTKLRLNPENATRSFELYLDESELQTRKIQLAQRRARTLAGWEQEASAKATIKLHQNAQRLLRSVRVVNEWADRISFPTSFLRTRRDHDRFLSLIEVICFLHQHQRELRLDQKGRPYVLATLDDYKIAYDLARTALAHSLADCPRPTRDLLQQIEAMVAQKSSQEGIQPSDYSFSRRQLREWTRLPDHFIKRQMILIEDLEYVQVTRSGKGGSYQYRLLSPAIADGYLDSLTSPAQLANRLESRTTGTKWIRSRPKKVARKTH